MVEHWFNVLTTALNGGYTLAILAAFGWGMLSILLSPCHLSSIPLIIGYITSRSIKKTHQSFQLSLVFSLGILITVATIGLITASLGRLLGDVGVFGNYFVAIIFFLVGLYLMDLLPLPWDGFNINHGNRSGLLGALLLGLAFGVGLGPCTFAYMAPVLGVVFQTSHAQILKGILMILAFGIGHCSVITAAGSAAHVVQKYLNWTETSTVTIWLRRSAGLLVIFGGVYFLTSIR